MGLVSKHSIQVDSVGVQIHTDNIWRGVVKVEVTGVHTHYKWTRSVEDACQGERAQGDVGTLPLEGEDHLRRDKRGKLDYCTLADNNEAFYITSGECLHQTPELNLDNWDLNALLHCS